MSAVSTTQESSRAGDTDRLPKRKPTLLVVDDEEGPREALRLIFKDEYDILVAGSGSAALDTAAKNQVDVAVLDIRMSGMSGIELLARLKEFDPAIEVVMMTAFETTDTIRQALKLRACDYINKPFDINTMRAAVAHALQKRKLGSGNHTNEERIEELRDQLHSQKVQEQMSHTRGEIYASIIHDMNGPLTVISGFTQLLTQRIGNAETVSPEDLEFIKTWLKTITRQVTNCIEISRRYLSFLRDCPDEGSRVGVNQLLIDLSHLVNVHPSRKMNQVSIRPLSQDVFVRMNGTDLIQILLNLTVNAFQCLDEPHTVEIQGLILTEPVDLRAFKDGPQDRLLNVEKFENSPPLLQISVRDTGPGIPAETLPKIFQPYFTTKSATQGTGLGLNIVQRLIKEAKGALHLHTEVGKGSAFTAYLPAIPLHGN